MIKAIIFDLSEVYIHGLLKFKRDTNLEFNTSLKHPLIRNILIGKITENYFWQEMKKEYGWNQSVDYLKNSIRQGFQIYDYKIPEIVNKIKSKYKVGLLSDHVKEWIEDYIEPKYKLNDLFETCIYSYQVGDVKIGKGIMFETMCNLIQVEPKKCLFIDDSEKNCAKAKTLGFQTIKFTNSNELTKILNNEGYLN